MIKLIRRLDESVEMPVRDGLSGFAGKLRRCLSCRLHIDNDRICWSIVKKSFILCFTIDQDFQKSTESGTTEIERTALISGIGP
jgi:hypothetical protein